MNSSCVQEFIFHMIVLCSRGC